MKSTARTLPYKKIVNTSLLTLFTLIAMISFALAADSKPWSNQEFKVKGNWSIEQRADGNYIVLDEAFKTRGAPDLKLFVSKTNYSDITGKNATSNADLVAKLKSNKGAQSYKIPSNINVSDYQSLIIHCEQYSKLWASTPLQ